MSDWNQPVTMEEYSGSDHTHVPDYGGPNEPTQVEIFTGRSSADRVQATEVPPFDVPSMNLSEIPGVGKLRKALRVDIEVEGGSYLLHAADLDITETGPTFAEALDAFCAFLREDAAHWRTADDSTLTAEALALKNRYKEYAG